MNQVTRATRKTFYKCPPDIAKNECDRPSFQIPTIMGLILKKPQSVLTVIATDLDLAEAEVVDRETGSLGDSIKNIFESGRSIGLFTIKSNFNGIVYGLPEGLSYDKATRRPAHILLVGPVEKIIEFHRILDQEFTKIVENLQYKFWLFTDKIIKNQISEKSLKSSDYRLTGGAERTNTLKENIKKIPQFILKRNSGQVEIEVDLTKNYYTQYAKTEPN